MDGRLAVARRAKALAKLLRAKLGHEARDPLVATKIIACAEMTAMAEVLRGKVMDGDKSVAANEAVRCSRAAELMMRQLGVDRRKGRPNATLEQYLARDRSEDRTP